MGLGVCMVGGMGMIALLIAVGLVLLFLETLLPGLIAGALGLLSLGAAVVYAYVEFDTRTGNATLAIVLVLLIQNLPMHVPSSRAGLNTHARSWAIYGDFSGYVAARAAPKFARSA